MLGLLIALGGLLAAGISQQTASFGWFAYAPLSQGTFRPAVAFLSPTVIGGLTALVVGVALAAFAAGWMLARRRAIREPDGPEAH